MKLVTEALKQQLPPLYATEQDADPWVICKFFTPWTHWTWYVIEYDGEDLFFGWVAGDYPELGYFRKFELESISGPVGLRIERDLHFTPCRLSEIRHHTST